MQTKIRILRNIQDGAKKIGCDIPFPHDFFNLLMRSINSDIRQELSKQVISIAENKDGWVSDKKKYIKVRRALSKIIERVK